MGEQESPNMKEVSDDNQKMLYQDLDKFRAVIDEDDWEDALELVNQIYERTVLIAVIDQLINPEKYHQNVR